MEKDVLDLLLCPSCHNPTLNISNISYENKPGKVKVWSPLIYIQLLLFKGVLNLFATKPSSNML